MQKIIAILKKYSIKKSTPEETGVPDTKTNY